MPPSGENPRKRPRCRERETRAAGKGERKRAGESEMKREEKKKGSSGNKARGDIGDPEDSPGSPDSLESVSRRAHIRPAHECISSER